MIEKLGAILLRKTNLTEDNLQAALKVQEKTGERIGEILIKQKSIKELDLLQALSDQFRLDVVPVLPLEIATDFTKVIPIAFLKKNAIVPIITEEDRYIAMYDPCLFQAYDDICQLLEMEGCPSRLLWSAPLLDGKSPPCRALLPSVPRHMPSRGRASPSSPSRCSALRCCYRRSRRGATATSLTAGG